jgi:hypothetical protein
VSSSIYWRPEPKDDHLVDKDVWRALKALNGYALETLGEADLRDLKALDVAGINGAKDLIDAIRLHGRIQLVEKY